MNVLSNTAFCGPHEILGSARSVARQISTAFAKGEIYSLIFCAHTVRSLSIFCNGKVETACLAVPPALWFGIGRMGFPSTHYMQGQALAGSGTLSEEVDVVKIVASQADRIAARPSSTSWHHLVIMHMFLGLLSRAGMKKEPFAYGRMGRDYASVISSEKSWRQALGCFGIARALTKLAQVSEPYLDVRVLYQL
jgi:hypothetical protein